MNWIQSLILGLIQGLTEFLPVSSSGHIELGKALLGVNIEENLLFTVILHTATVLSTLVVFRKDLAAIFKGLFNFKWNESYDFTIKIILSMIPAAIAGLLWENQIESLFTGNILFVGSMLIGTSLVLALTTMVRHKGKEINYFRAFIIGLAQAVAILPGLSRSGATIATGLYLGIDKDKVTRFSFLMVIIPILGASFLSLIKADETFTGNIALLPLVIGFLAAFVSGWFACRWMISIVKRGKLIYFSAYCLAAGLIAIIFGLV